MQGEHQIYSPQGLVQRRVIGNITNGQLGFRIEIDRWLSRWPVHLRR